MAYHPRLTLKKLKLKKICRNVKSIRSRLHRSKMSGTYRQNKPFQFLLMKTVVSCPGISNETHQLHTNSHVTTNMAYREKVVLLRNKNFSSAVLISVVWTNVWIIMNKNKSTMAWEHTGNTYRYKDRDEPKPKVTWIAHTK